MELADPANFDTPITPAQAPVPVHPVSVQSTASVHHPKEKGGLRVTEITSLDELRSIEQTWWLLLEQTPDADYFRTPYWLEAYIERFGAEIDLKVLVISEGDQAIGILPLVVAPFRSSLGNFRVLTYPCLLYTSPSPRD